MLSRKKNKINFNNSEDIEFSVIDWFECDVTKKVKRKRGEDATFFLNEEHNKTYTIFAFGVTIEGYSVCLRINGYFPYFYIQIPDNFTEDNINELKKIFNSNKSEEIDEEEFIDIQESSELKKKDKEELLNELKFESEYFKSSIKESLSEIEESQIFWSFMNGKIFKFYKIVSRSKTSNRFLSNYLKNPITLNNGTGNKIKHKFHQFESDLEPQLRFFHDTNIKPANWIKINKNNFKIETNQSKCQINISCHWRDIIALDKTEIPPLIVASFDIEADSSHGDFPQPDKDCKKLANQLVITWIRDNRIINTYDSSNKSEKDNESYLKAKGQLELKEYYFDKRIQQAIGIGQYQNYDYDIDLIYLKEPSKAKHLIKMPVYLEMIKNIYHICNRPLKKVKTDTNMKNAVNEVTIQHDDYLKNNKFLTIDTYIKIINEVAKAFKIPTQSLQDKIISKEVMSRFVNQELNKVFGKANGDPVIQIGTVFWRFGDDRPFHNNIITLKGCSDFKVGDQDCEIISKQKEINVLFEWSKLIEEYDPDIITGYNIFGFDESFMYDRLIDIISGNQGIKKRINNLSKAEMNEIRYSDEYKKFMNLTRLDDSLLSQIYAASGRLVNKKLASSALGENYLYYFNMPGRVQIDLLKVCQSSMTKLPSYKLDNVAEFYISGKIKKFLSDPDFPDNDKTKIIEVENIKELDEGNFVVISMMTTGQKLYDGEKLKLEYLDRTNSIIKLNKPIPTDCLANIPTWGLAKDDVSPKDIFRLQKGTDQDRAIIAKYCIQDCALLIRLLKKLDSIPNNVGMSNVCIVPFSYIFMRGQGIKIFSLVVNECKLNGFKLPVLEKIAPEEVIIDDSERIKNTVSNEKDDEDKNEESLNKNNVFQLKSDFNVIKMTEDGYEGAIVLKPKPDIYTEPITVLDFSSLYPSEMIASDLSHDRICEDPYWLGDEGAKRIKELGLDYLDRKYDNLKWVDPTNPNKGKKRDGETIVRFIQYPDGRKGLIPRILMKLLGARKATKKRIKLETDPFKCSILDGLQLAYKLTANSLYGQIGATTSKIYKKQIAASTTAGGRMRIYTARDYCLENNKGCEVVYGDSIPGDEPILISFNINSKIDIKITREKETKLTKESDLLKNDNKQKEQYIEIQDLIKNSNSCDYKNEFGKEYFIPKDKIKVWSDKGFTDIKYVIRHKINKKLYRIETTTGIVTVTEDHSLLDKNGNVIKPSECKIGDILLTSDLPKKIFTKNQINKINYNINLIFPYDGVISKYNINNYNKVYLANKYALYSNLNGNLELYYDKDKLVYYKTKHHIVPGMIKRITCLSNSNYHADISHNTDDNINNINNNTIHNTNNRENYEYVYDLETENHHFSAGIGNLVVHNTDSVFVKFNLKDEHGNQPITDIDKVRKSIEIGQYIQDKLKIDKVFPAPHDLEYEKVFMPLILITKKRYIGIKYEFDPEKGKKTSMGVVTKRRDNAPILKHTFIGVVDTLMKEKDILKAVKFVQDICYQMIDDKFDINMFVISKTLKEYYKDPESIAHKVLADRMAARDPGNKPSSNERIPYIYIKIEELPGVKYLQGDKIEHINYVRENKCKIDYITYITNQLLKPVSQIFELVVDKLPNYPYNYNYFEQLENVYYNKYKGDLKKTSNKISELKQKLIKKLIFDVVINHASNKLNNINTLDKWVVPDKSIDVKEKKKREKYNTNHVKKLKQTNISKWFN